MRLVGCNPIQTGICAEELRVPDSDALLEEGQNLHLGCKARDTEHCRILLVKE